MKKTILTKVISILVAFAMIFIVACGPAPAADPVVEEAPEVEEPAPEPEPADDPEPADEPEEVVVEEAEAPVEEVAAEIREEAIVEEEKTSMLDSDEYKAIIDRYMDEKGKLNYKLLNKDFIQFASKSKSVSKMIGERARTEDILTFVVKSRAALVAGKKNSLDDELATALIETLDEIDPRSAFKELKAYINRMLARNK